MDPLGLSLSDVLPTETAGRIDWGPEFFVTLVRERGKSSNRTMSSSSSGAPATIIVLAAVVSIRGGGGSCSITMSSSSSSSKTSATIVFLAANRSATCPICLLEVDGAERTWLDVRCSAWTGCPPFLRKQRLHAQTSSSARVFKSFRMLTSSASRIFGSRQE